jgi:hypothetical protein
MLGSCSCPHKNHWKQESHCLALTKGTANEKEGVCVSFELQRVGETDEVWTFSSFALCAGLDSQKVQHQDHFALASVWMENVLRKRESKSEESHIVDLQ